MIVPASKYLLAILNSTLADYYIRQLGVTRNGGYFEYKPMFIDKLPVPILSKNNETYKKIEEMVDMSLFADIDSIVYSLYELNDDEVAYIESISNHQ